MNRLLLFLAILSSLAILACNNGRADNYNSQATLPAFTQPTNTANTTNITTKLNPAHGEPGHRCDIAVGAPLNSTPTTAPNSITQNVTPTTITPKPAAQATLPGMNPSHGQPGHRCDIAVGAPLDSKPAQSKSSVPAPPALPVIPSNSDTTKN